jgi:hypothetical protein
MSSSSYSRLRRIRIKMQSNVAQVIAFVREKVYSLASIFFFLVGPSFAFAAAPLPGLLFLSSQTCRPSYIYIYIYIYNVDVCDRKVEK